MIRRHALVLASAACAALTCLLAPAAARAQTSETLTLRGHAQTVRLYGTRGGTPVVVSSGDGGWMHLGPHVAEVLAARGYFVVGFDAKGYLSSFTSGKTVLSPADIAGDYAAIAAFAAKGSSQPPVLVGVSEGAGLSVLAASDPTTKAALGGVIGLGVPDQNELGWRWTDSVIYVTHGTPNEPTFSTTAVVDRLAPLPFAAIHSTHDEFVPMAEVESVVARAKDPKRLWVVPAADHRFSDNLAGFDQRLFEALAWIQASRTKA